MCQLWQCLINDCGSLFPALCWAVLSIGEYCRQIQASNTGSLCKQNDTQLIPHVGVALAALQELFATALRNSTPWVKKTRHQTLGRNFTNGSSRLGSKFATNSCLNIPPSFKHVATLPCEIWMQKNGIILKYVLQLMMDSQKEWRNTSGRLWD